MRSMLFAGSTAWGSQKLEEATANTTAAREGVKSAQMLEKQKVERGIKKARSKYNTLFARYQARAGLRTQRSEMEPVRL